MVVAGISLSAAAPAAATDTLYVNNTATANCSDAGSGSQSQPYGPTSAGVLTVYPDDPRPSASNLNWVAGQTVPNLVVVPVVNGKVKFFNNSPGTVHVVADLAGYFTQ